MTPERWQQIKAVYAQAEEAPPGQQTAILDQFCTTDPELRQIVQQLLSENSSGTFIQSAIGEQAADLNRPTPTNDRFGRYRILRRIGQGGMGAVYEAVRTGDFEKRVALKIIKQEFDSDSARARFQQERQFLAILEHPYIARLIDGGESEDGSPYLVIEYIDGQPFDDYCANLDRTARLHLFLKVCEAVEYAHRNLVIHRDLKPANILVTPAGDPKLLDFGIAKLLDPAATATRTGMLAMTPDYASPEQVRGQPISTASDVYSLGVILYQLFTGRRPYKLETVTPFELDRVICLEPPEPPNLGNDLDDILLMALRKEPSRRYGSVQQFSDDLTRWLDNRPVTARPDTFFYVSGKYARRHWVGLVSTVIAFAGLLLGAGIALNQAHRAERRFDQVRAMANKFLFQFHDDLQYIAGTTKAREHMVSTARDYLDSLAAEAGNDPQLLGELATAYQKLAGIQGRPNVANLGHSEAALGSYNKALALREKLVAQKPSDEARRSLAGLYSERAALFAFLSRPAEALASAQKADALAAQLLAKASPSLADYGTAAQAATELGHFHMAKGQTAIAIKEYKKAAGFLERLATANPTLETRLAYAGALDRAAFAMLTPGDLLGGLAMYRKEETLTDATYREAPENTRVKRMLLVVYQNIGSLYFNNAVAHLLQPQQALPYLSKMRVLAEQMHAADPNDETALDDVVFALTKSAGVLLYLDPAKADSLNEQALALARTKKPGPQKDYLISGVLVDLVQGYAAEGDFGKAHRDLKETETLIRRQVSNLAAQSDAERNLAVVRYREADLALREHNLKAASDAADRFLKVVEKEATDSPDSLNARYDLSTGYDLMAQLAQASGDRAQARAWQQKKLETWKEWEAHYIPNPYSKAQLADATRALGAR